MFPRLSLGIFLLVFFVLSAAYSGSLISFFTVTILPPPADTFDQVAELADANDMDVAICCDFIKFAMEASSLPSFQKLSKRVRNNNLDMLQGGMLVVRTFIIASYKIFSIKMLQKWQIGQSSKKPLGRTPYMPLCEACEEKK